MHTQVWAQSHEAWRQLPWAPLAQFLICQFKEIFPVFRGWKELQGPGLEPKSSFWSCYRKHLNCGLRSGVRELNQRPRPTQTELIGDHLLTLPLYHTWRDPRGKGSMTGDYSQATQDCLNLWGKVTIELLTSVMSKLEEALGII